MMQCPVCGTTYTDATLRFCLADGAALTVAEQETVVRSAGQNPLRVDIPARDTAQKFQPSAPQQKSGPPIIKIFLALVVLGVIVVAAAGLIGAIFYFSSAGTGTNQNVKSGSPISTASPSPTVDPEKQRLQDELANAQRQLDEQKNANRAANVQPFPTDNEPGVVTARVNSPGDGFLAMRSEPSADYGERVAKIPHGAVVNIQNCERDRVRIGSRTGRWCMVTYARRIGWVFDAWLDY